MIEKKASISSSVVRIEPWIETMLTVVLAVTVVKN